MRSTKKKGPRTPALLRVRTRSLVATRVDAPSTTAAMVNAMWQSAQTAFIPRGEPPEPEPNTQITPIKPLPKSGGAQACPEKPMATISPEELQRQRHQIATLAAETAGRVASHLQYDPLLKEARLSDRTPAAAGKAVTDAYQAALKQLSEGAAPRAAAVATGD